MKKNTTLMRAIALLVLSFAFAGCEGAKSNDARLIKIIGIDISAVGEGTPTSPKTASINVAVTQSVVETIKVETAARATAMVYTDSDFIMQVGASVKLSVGTTHLYAKVIAEDGSAVYYDVSINKPPAAKTEYTIGFDADVAAGTELIEGAVGIKQVTYEVTKNAEAQLLTIRLKDGRLTSALTGDASEIMTDLSNEWKATYTTAGTDGTEIVISFDDNNPATGNTINVGIDVEALMTLVTPDVSDAPPYSGTLEVIDGDTVENAFYYAVSTAQVKAYNALSISTVTTRATVESVFGGQGTLLDDFVDISLAYKDGKKIVVVEYDGITEIAADDAVVKYTATDAIVTVPITGSMTTSIAITEAEDPTDLTGITGDFTVVAYTTTVDESHIAYEQSSRSIKVADNTPIVLKDEADQSVITALDTLFGANGVVATDIISFNSGVIQGIRIVVAFPSAAKINTLLAVSDITLGTNTTLASNVTVPAKRQLTVAANRTLTLGTGSAIILAQGPTPGKIRLMGSATNPAKLVTGSKFGADAIGAVSFAATGTAAFIDSARSTATPETVKSLTAGTAGANVTITGRASGAAKISAGATFRHTT
jgi:hypothetical protein